MFSPKGPVLHPLWHLTCGVVAATAFSTACTTDADPGDGDPMASGGSGGMMATGGTGGTMSAGGAAQGGGAGAPPAQAAALQCESTQFPKVVAAGTNPVILDFDTGTLVLVDAMGLPIVNFPFVVPASEVSGGTYAYQEVDTPATAAAAAFDTNVTRTAELVDDGNGGQALSVTLTEATGFGGGMGLFLFPCGDASAYNGITFRARGSLPERMVDTTIVPAGTVNARLDVGEVRTNSLDTIACANNIPTDATLCTRPETSFVIGADWAEFTFMWGDFTPGNANGTAVVPTGDNLLGLDLSMDNAFGTANTLQFVIDDIAFVP